jgi:DNA-binding IclR family transcriptional regulator
MTDDEMLKVKKTMQENECITVKEIEEKTGLPRKTVLAALRNLHSRVEIQECTEQGRYRLMPRMPNPKPSRPSVQGKARR